MSTPSNRAVADAVRALEEYGMEPMCGMASAAPREDAYLTAVDKVLTAAGAMSAVTPQMVDRAARELYRQKSGTDFDREPNIHVHMHEAALILAAALGLE